MMHSMDELYKINGQKFYTKDYIIAHNVPKRKSFGSNEGWSLALYACANKKGYITIITADGEKKGYLFGERAWFDTEEERDAYRAQRNAQMAENSKRNKMLKAIMVHYESMSTEELEQVVCLF